MLLHFTIEDTEIMRFWQADSRSCWISLAHSELPSPPPFTLSPSLMFLQEQPQTEEEGKESFFLGPSLSPKAKFPEQRSLGMASESEALQTAEGSLQREFTTDKALELNEAPMRKGATFPCPPLLPQICKISFGGRSGTGLKRRKKENQLQKRLWIKEDWHGSTLK